jgi:lipoprotein NlpD
MMTQPRQATTSTARLRTLALAVWVLTVLGACASAQHKAPVEDRAAPRGSGQATAASALGTDAAKPPPGAENAGKPGYYTVKPGDTLIRIGLDSGQNWRDVARWNNIDNPNLLEVGQVLRVAAPGADTTVTTARAVPPTKVEARPLDNGAAVPAAASAAVASAASASTVAASAVAPSTVAASAPLAPVTVPASGASVAREDDVAWVWPSGGSVVTQFDEVTSKGLVFGGKAGDPVFAAGDGRVIYVGSGVRGYGNLVIVKHNNTYLTAYAHNQALLVKEDQVVRRGQKIAEMGSSDAERVQLHFEIRKLGKPVDPARLLPAR